MIETMIFVLAGIGGFVIARNFVRNRLRYVDAIRSPLVPILAGVGAALVSWPLAALPLITTATSAIFGLGAGFGTRSGVKAIQAGQ